MNKEHVGSNFDDFLAEYGILSKSEKTAIKRVIVYLVVRLMREPGKTPQNQS